MKHKTLARTMIALCATAVTLTHFSCEKPGNNYSEEHSLHIPAEYKVIGEKHNEGLEYAFQAIRAYYTDQMTKSGGMPERMSREELLTLGEESAITFVKKHSSDVPEEFYQNLIENMGDAVTKSADQPVSEAYAYIERIKQVLENGPKDENHLMESLNEINQEAAQNLSKEDAIAVYAGTSTCYNSYMYWKGNRIKWIVALNFPEYLTEYSDEELNSFVGKELIASQALTKSWWDDAWSTVGETWDSIKGAVTDWWDNGGKAVVGADAGAAIMGAVEGALLGSSVGGVGAGPGAILGGIGIGASASIEESISQWVAN